MDVAETIVATRVAKPDARRRGHGREEPDPEPNSGDLKAIFSSSSHERGAVADGEEEEGGVVVVLDDCVEAAIKVRTVDALDKRLRRAKRFCRGGNAK